jgi:hypothetical protein
MAHSILCIGIGAKLRVVIAAFKAAAVGGYYFPASGYTVFSN